MMIGNFLIRLLGNLEEKPINSSALEHSMHLIILEILFSLLHLHFTCASDSFLVLLLFLT